jgi:hypothetical protein
MMRRAGAIPASRRLSNGMRSMPVQRLTAVERARVEAWSDDPVGTFEAARSAERARIGWNRVWAAVVLAVTLDVARSILRGKPVLATQLDAVVLRRALRGSPLPPAGTYVRVTDSMLDAVAESGAFPRAELRR